MKKIAIFSLMAAVFAVCAAEIKVPVLWERHSGVRDFQFAKAGYAGIGGKHVIAGEVKNFTGMIKKDGSVAIYWNCDGDKNTGRFPGSQGIDLQINIAPGRDSIQIIRWFDDRKRADIDADAVGCEFHAADNKFVLTMSEKMPVALNVTSGSRMVLNLNVDGKRSDSIIIVDGAKTDKVMEISVPEHKAVSGVRTGNISVPVCWSRRNASDCQVEKAGVFQDDDKYIFAFKVKNLPGLLTGKTSAAVYWNCDGDKNTGRFPGSQGVDVQFNIDLKSRRINAVVWADAVSHRFMTMYEDDYLVEICGDVLYLALRKPALTQCRIKEPSDFSFQISDGKKRDRIFCRIRSRASGTFFIEPALNFVRFGALKSSRVKKSFAVPVARKNARSTVWECGGERFAPDEATPEFSKEIPSLHLKAARGETASVFFAVESPESFSRLEITPGTLSSGAKAISADVQSVQYADYVADDRGDMFTDILFPKFPGKPVRRQFVVWHLTVPRTAAAGTYRGELKLSVGDRSDTAIPVQVTVYNFAIPEVPAMRSAFSVKNGHISARFGDGGVCKSIYDTMIERCAKFRFGPRLPGAEPKFKLDEAGKLHISWEAFDKRIKYLIDEIHANSIQLPPCQLGSHDKFVRWNSILRKNYRNTDDPEFRSVYKQYVRQYADHMKELGVADKMLFVVWDEPYSLDEPLKGAGIVRETAPEIPIGIFIDRYDPAGADKIDIWLVTLQVLAKTLKEAQGKKVWLYNSGGVNNFKLPASDLRSFFFLADRYGIAGFLSSEINVIAKSGIKDGIYFNHYPQHCLFYVSKDGKEVFDSWRLVLLRQGFNDYDYLAFYRKLLARAGEELPKWLVEAEPVFDAEGMPDFKIDTTGELDRLKERIAGEIERLTAKLAL